MAKGSSSCARFQMNQSHSLSHSRTTMLMKKTWCSQDYFVHAFFFVSSKSQALQRCQIDGQLWEGRSLSYVGGNADKEKGDPEFTSTVPSQVLQWSSSKLGPKCVPSRVSCIITLRFTLLWRVSDVLANCQRHKPCLKSSLSSVCTQVHYPLSPTSWWFCASY